MNASPTVFLVDDDSAIRKLVSQLVWSVRLPVEGFDSAEAFLALVPPSKPGCLVLDIRLPTMSGLAVQQALIARGSSIPIIVLTGYGDVPTAVQMLKAGAFDFVEKPFQNHRLLDAIQAALRHDQQVHFQRARKTEVAARLATLTAGEKAVLDRMVEGNGYKSIAKDLDISYKTVQARRAQIMKKMGAQDLPGLMHLFVGSKGVVAVS